jgi:hypothetical protein
MTNLSSRNILNSIDFVFFFIGLGSFKVINGFIKVSMIFYRCFEVKT